MGDSSLERFDVAVIGGGIVGSAIAYEISKFAVTLALIEREPDVGEGTSKANSGIAHTGFDSKPGTLESRLLKRARTLWPQVVEELGIPFVPCGAIMVARNETEMQTVSDKVYPNALANEAEVRLLTREEVLELAPYVTNNVVGGLHIPGESLVDPFWVTRAYAEAAVSRGAKALIGDGVVGLVAIEGGERIEITLASGKRIVASCVVNAAGLWSDEVAAMIGDTSFALTPRRGQFYLSEDDLGISMIILPVPNEKSKGILVTPLAIGGIIAGPTAEDMEDKTDRSTTTGGLDLVLEATRHLVPAIKSAHFIRQFAGLRAVSAVGDYIIRPATTTPRLLHVAGIRSTGVSASPAIAWRVAETLAGMGLLEVRTCRPTLLPPEQRTADQRPGREEAVQNPVTAGDTQRTDENEVVCLCRSITRGEILNALRGRIPARTLDGVKRRAGAMLGECQGNRCLAKIMGIMAEYYGVPAESIEKHARGSYVAVAPGGGEN